MMQRIGLARSVGPALFAACGVSLILALVLSVCGSSRHGASAAECPLTVEYSGHLYVGTGYAVAPVPGRSLWEATVPACQDEPDTPPGPDATIELAEGRGVPAEVAVMERRNRGGLFIPEDVDHAQLPPQLERLLKPSACHEADEPIRLAGQWLGIIGADGHTELDLVPPYDLLIYVESSASRYKRAQLTIRVPGEAGPPLDRDIESRLWEGGSLSLTAGCGEGGAFVAQRVEAHPPD